MKKVLWGFVIVFVLFVGISGYSDKSETDTNTPEKTESKTHISVTKSAPKETNKVVQSNEDTTFAERQTVSVTEPATTEKNSSETQLITEPSLAMTEPTTSSAEAKNPYNNPGKWSLHTMTSYSHISDSVIYLGNDESATISIEASTPGMNYDDFLIVYDETLLNCEPLFINDDYDGKTLLKYKLWHIAPGRTEVAVASSFEFVEKGEDCSAYTLEVVGLDSQDGRVVYVTSRGEKYHFSSACAGENGMATTILDAIQAGYEPCGKCAN